MGARSLTRGVKDLAHDPDRGLAASGGSSVAVEPVLGHVDVMRGEVGGAELVDDGEDFAEVVFGVGLAAIVDDDLEALHDPLIDQGEFGWFFDCLASDVSEEDAEGVAEAAVGFADLLEEVFAERDFVLPIDGGDPEAEDVGAVLVVEVGGVGGFAFLFVVGFGGFLSSVLIDDEAVSEDGFVGSGVADADAEHEGGLEPTAVLVGGFKVEVGGSREFWVAIEDGDVAGAGVDPDVEGVAAFAGASGKVEEGGEFVVGFFEPDIGAVFFNEVGDFVSDVGIDDGFAFWIEEDGNGDAPGALA